MVTIWGPAFAGLRLWGNEITDRDTSFPRKLLFWRSGARYRSKQNWNSATGSGGILTNPHQQPEVTQNTRISSLLNLSEISVTRKVNPRPTSWGLVRWWPSLRTSKCMKTGGDVDKVRVWEMAIKNKWSVKSLFSALLLMKHEEIFHQLCEAETRHNEHNRQYHRSKCWPRRPHAHGS